MPGLKVCVDCWRLTPKTRCPEHERTASQGWQGQHRTEQPTPRIRGRKLQALRLALFTVEPFCRMCKIRLAEIRDHIVPLAEGGTDEPSNIQPLCQACSDRKTHDEAARGVRRDW